MNKFLQRLVDAIQEKSWFQQLRSKWDELDAQSKTYIQGASAVFAVLALGWLFIGSWWSVHSLKNEIAEKDEIIRMIQFANSELHSLKEQIPPSARSNDSVSAQPWSNYFENVAGMAGIDRGSLNISTETAGKTHEFSKEGLYEVNLRQINVKQLTKFSFQIENGQRPVKIQKLLIETKPDLSGYMDAKFSLVTYTTKSSS